MNKIDSGLLEYVIELLHVPVHVDLAVSRPLIVALSVILSSILRILYTFFNVHKTDESLMF